MREGLGQPGQQLLTGAEKSMESWVWLKKIVFYGGYNAHTLF
jgi:hypothetical protein